MTKVEIRQQSEQFINSIEELSAMILGDTWSNDNLPFELRYRLSALASGINAAAAKLNELSELNPEDK